jgi:hypothetical protein
VTGERRSLALRAAVSTVDQVGRPPKTSPSSTAQLNHFLAVPRARRLGSIISGRVGNELASSPGGVHWQVAAIGRTKRFSQRIAINHDAVRKITSPGDYFDRGPPSNRTANQPQCDCGNERSFCASLQGNPPKPASANNDRIMTRFIRSRRLNADRRSLSDRHADATDRYHYRALVVGVELSVD